MFLLLEAFQSLLFEPPRSAAAVTTTTVDTWQNKLSENILPLLRPLLPVRPKREQLSVVVVVVVRE